MKTFREYLNEQIEIIDVQFYTLFEDLSTASSTTTDGIENPDAKPLFKKSTVFGKTCLEVDSDTYNACIKGKIPFKRWKNYVGDSELEQEVKKLYYKNKKLLLKNSDTGSMIYLK